MPVVINRWPKTLDEFWEYWNYNIQNLEVTDWARSLARDLLWPKKMPLLLKPNMPIARLLTIHWLPERMQREFRFKITPLNTAMYHFVVGYTAMVYPHVPSSWKKKPAKFYIADMKKAVKKIRETGDWSTEKERIVEREDRVASAAAKGVTLPSAEPKPVAAPA